VDLDIQKVRRLRIKMRTMHIAVLAAILVYIILCLHFLLIQKGGIDYRFVFFLLLPIPFIVHAERKERNDKMPFSIKLNRFLAKDGISVHEPTSTQRHIVESFFEEKGWEMPQLFTCKAPMPNAMIGKIHRTYFLLITEDLYRVCSIWDIWAVLAHEKGHLMNGDMNWMLTEKILFILSQWVSVILLVKIWGSMIFSPSDLVYSLPVYFMIVWGIIAYLWVVMGLLYSVLFSIKEILADNTAAQILGSSVPMIECLRKITPTDSIHFLERERALLWVQKKEGSEK